MNNKVVNKQIPLETIVKVANHLEDYKQEYSLWRKTMGIWKRKYNDKIYNRI